MHYAHVMAKPQPIVGGTLDWAIRDANENVETLEARLGMGGKIHAWITEDEKPNLGDVQKLSMPLPLIPEVVR